MTGADKAEANNARIIPPPPTPNNPINIFTVSIHLLQVYSSSKMNIITNITERNEYMISERLCEQSNNPSVPPVPVQMKSSKVGKMKIL